MQGEMTWPIVLQVTEEQKVQRDADWRGMNDDELAYFWVASLGQRDSESLNVQDSNPGRVECC